MTQQEAIQSLIGDIGSPKRITGTGQVTGTMYSIKAINGEAVFSELTFVNGGGLVSGDRLAEGDSISLRVSSFTLISGVVIAYGEPIVQA